MNTKTTIAIIAAVAILAAAITPTLMTSAFAAISDACEKKNGQITEGECKGKSENKEDVRVNPAGEKPPGQNKD